MNDIKGTKQDHMSLKERKVEERGERASAMTHEPLRKVEESEKLFHLHKLRRKLRKDTSSSLRRSI